MSASSTYRTVNTHGTFSVGVLIAMGVLLLASVRVHAHGSEFIFAKLTTGIGQEVQLELTADYGANPMISTEDDAREILGRVFQLKQGDRAVDLATLGEMRFERRAQFDSTAPLPKGPPGTEDTMPHQLLTAIVRWKPGTAEVAFQIPSGTPHCVIFWTVNAATGQTDGRWLSLVNGEFTPAIPVPTLPAVAASAPANYWPYASAAALLIIPLAWRRRRINSTRQ